MYIFCVGYKYRNVRRMQCLLLLRAGDNGAHVSEPRDGEGDDLKK